MWLKRRDSRARARPGRPGPPATILALTLMAATLIAVPGPASAATPEPVLTNPRVGEFQPAPDDGFLAWQQNSKKRPRHFNVFARPTGGDRFRVNTRRTNGANGGIDGDSLVYQQYRRGKSNLKFFNLETRERTNPAKAVNTKHWEYWPTISGQRLLFGRLKDNGARRIILWDRDSKTSRTLARSRRGSFAAPGQVEGDYAVWYKCRPNSRCNVFRYQISADEKTKIPNPGSFQRAPSVASDGTVYFVRSGASCGRDVRLVSFPSDGAAITQLRAGADISSTRVHTTAQGAREIFYERNDCDDPTGSDVYKIDDPNIVELTAEVTGSGGGTVTSDPSGIDCGNDCTQHYKSGTEVKLTAIPNQGSEFRGWGGACSVTATTCAVTMDEAQAVTATFEPPTSFVSLSVTKVGSGNGTVTGNPGINCGSDCTESYPIGTSVMLTASAASGSIFEGWDGACGGSSTTCTVTMDAPRSVGADFRGINQHMTVSKSGNGTGTVTSEPPGINCGSDCDEEYELGDSVMLTASPDASSDFTGWSGDQCDSQTATTCRVDMDGPKSVTATFTLKTHELTVSTAGDGSGQVTSNPVGIDCDRTVGLETGDCKETYNHGTGVTLTAAAGSGSDFIGWSGDCSGTDTTCMVTMDAAKSVTATFDDPLLTSRAVLGNETLSFDHLLARGAGPVRGDFGSGDGAQTENVSPGFWLGPLVDWRSYLRDLLGG